jgi:predicted DNA-binding transcriptional regulator AlpA
VWANVECEYCFLMFNLHGAAMLATTTSADTTAPRALPADLADVAFLDIKDVCTAVRMSASWVHDEVRTGTFPAPLRFGNRCSRWRVVDIRAWLVARAAQADTDNAGTGSHLVAKAKRASDAAKAKRQGA